MKDYLLLFIALGVLFAVLVRALTRPPKRRDGPD
jgi:hypothetical protein